jgi:Cupin superfamily protein
LASFCRQLEDAFGLGVQANSYYTPRGSQGFAVHHDTHDVLVLQVAGEKRWFLHEPLFELPLKHQRYTKSLGEEGEPSEDLVLRPGDTLYLPRGWLHQAETSDADSLHLTIGINAYTWVDAARAALKPLEGDVDLRRGVSADGLDPNELAERLRGQLAPDDVERRMRRRFLDTRRPIREDGLTQLRALDRLDPQTPVERRASVIADLDEDVGDLGLVFEGKELRFPEQARSELVACFEANEPFSASELPGDLDEAGRLVLVRRLVREGFLRVI